MASITPRALYDEAQVLEGLGRHQAARKVLKSGVKRFPRRVALHLQMARNALALAGPGAALRALDAVPEGIAVPPEQALPLRARAHVEMRDFERAATVLEEAEAAGLRSVELERLSAAVRFAELD